MDQVSPKKLFFYVSLYICKWYKKVFFLKESPFFPISVFRLGFVIRFILEKKEKENAFMCFDWHTKNISKVKKNGIRVFRSWWIENTKFYQKTLFRCKIFFFCNFIHYIYAFVLNKKTPSFSHKNCPLYFHINVVKKKMVLIEIIHLLWRTFFFNLIK